MAHEPKSEALRALYWRDEILQVMFWLRGEGFADVVDPALLSRFLGVDATVVERYLLRLVNEEYLTPNEGGYTLSEKGHAEGGRIFAEEFADMTRPAHGECGPDCWCHASEDEAEACAEERLAHGHS